MNSNGYVDQYGNWIYTGTTTTPVTGGLGYAISAQTQDWCDLEIQRLRQEMGSKDSALREAYCEIGRLHEQIRGMQAFDKWSEGVAKQAKTPAP